MRILARLLHLTASCCLFFCGTTAFSQGQYLVQVPPMEVGGQASGTFTIPWSTSFPLSPDVSFTVLSDNAGALDSLMCCQFSFTYASFDMAIDGDGLASGGYTELNWSLNGLQFPAETFWVEYNRGGTALGSIQFTMNPFIIPELPAISIATDEETAGSGSGYIGSYGGNNMPYIAANTCPSWLNLSGSVEANEVTFQATPSYNQYGSGSCQYQANFSGLTTPVLGTLVYDVAPVDDPHYISVSSSTSGLSYYPGDSTSQQTTPMASTSLGPNEPCAFYLYVSDSDTIDFINISSPLSGTLTGGISYNYPQSASYNYTFTPDPGFTGSVSMEVSYSDILGNDGVLFIELTYVPSHVFQPAEGTDIDIVINEDESDTLDFIARDEQGLLPPLAGDDIKQGQLLFQYQYLSTAMTGWNPEDYYNADNEGISAPYPYTHTYDFTNNLFANNYSSNSAAQIYGYFRPQETGEYNFSVTSGWGCNLLIGGDTVLTSATGMGVHGELTGTVNMTAGEIYPIRLRSWRFSSAGTLSLNWKKPSDTEWGMDADEVSAGRHFPTPSGAGYCYISNFQMGNQYLMDFTLNCTSEANTHTAGQPEPFEVDIMNRATQWIGTSQPTAISINGALSPLGADTTLFSADGTTQSVTVEMDWFGNVSPIQAPTVMQTFTMTLFTDAFGNETNWNLVNANGQAVMSGSNFQSNTSYTTSEVLPSGCYTLTINDTYGDGMTTGNYSLEVDGTVMAAGSGYDFTYQDQTTFCSDGSTPSNSPDTYPGDMEMALCAPDGACYTIGGHVQRPSYTMGSLPASNLDGGSGVVDCPYMDFDPYLCELCDASNPSGMFNDDECNLYGGTPFNAPDYCDPTLPSYSSILCEYCDENAPAFDSFMCELEGGIPFEGASGGDPDLAYPLNVGTPILEVSQNANQLVELGFSFSFYGQDYQQITVSTHGVVYLGEATNSETGCCPVNALPFASSAPSIHVFNTNLGYTSDFGGGIFVETYGSAPNREFVVSYYQIPESYNLVPIDAQLILREADGSIELYHGGYNNSNYTGITVGINAGDGVNASFDPAFNVAYMTAPTIFSWNPNPSGSTAAYPWPESWNDGSTGRYTHTFDLPSAMSGSGTDWSLMVTNTHEQGSSSYFDLSVSLPGLSPESPSLTIYPVNDPFVADFILEGAQGTPAPVTVTQNGGTAVTFLTTAVERDTVHISIAGFDADVLDTYSLTGQPTQGTATVEVIPAAALEGQEYAAELPAMGSAPASAFMAEGTLDSVTVSMNWNETTDVVPANLSVNLIAPDGTTAKLGGPQWDYAITTELSNPAPTFPLDQGVLSTVTDCDECTEVLQLGFAFPFYDEMVNEITVTSNGLVYMGTGQYSSGCCSGWSLPSSQGPSIHLAHSDLHSGTHGDVRYHTVGTEPNRTFVLSFEDVALFGNASTQVDGQLLLHEADGRIELYHGGVPSGSYHTFTMGINAGDGVRASYDPAFHQTSSTSPAHFEWEPIIDGYQSGPNGWPYSWTGDTTGTYLYTKSISGLSGTGAWSVKLEHEFDASAALPVDLNLAFHGLNKPMTALATYIGTDGLDEADTLKVQASDLQGNTAQLAMPIQIIKVNDGDATFSPESSLLTYEEDATFAFSLDVEDLDGLSTDLGLWSDSSLVAPAFFAAGGTCADFAASSDNGVLTVSCNCTAPANLSEGYHPEFTGPFGFEVHITDDQGFENTGSYLVEFSPVPDPTSFELLAPFDGGTLLSDTNAVSALTGSTPALMLSGTEDQDLAFELFILDNDGQSLPPFGNTTPQPVTASCSQATVNIMELGLSGAIMTNGSQPGKFLVLMVDPFEHVNGTIQVLVTSTDRFGTEVTLPLNIDLTPVNDPIALSLDNDGAGTLAHSTVLSNEVPATSSLWAVEMQVEEDTPLNIVFNATDVADGIGGSPITGVTGPWTASSIDGGTAATYSGDASLSNPHVYTPALEFPQHAEVIQGQDRDSLRFTVTDDDGHAVEVLVNIQVLPADDGQAQLTGESEVTWFEDATIRRTVTVSDPDGLTTKNISAISGAHGQATLVDTVAIDRQTLSVTYDYVPDADYHGTDEISLAVTDDQDFSSAPLSIVLTLQPLNDPMVFSSTLSDKCGANGSLESGENCDVDVDADGICDEEDDCIDMNCDGLCDGDIAAGMWAVPEDDTLMVDVNFQVSTVPEEASHTLSFVDCEAPAIPDGWSLLAATDSALYLISDATYENWFAARQATEQITGGKLFTPANADDLALLPNTASGWYGDYKLRMAESWTNVAGTAPMHTGDCNAGHDCFGWIANGAVQSASTATNLIDAKQAIMELPFGVCPEHGRLQAGVGENSWRYVPDWNYHGTDRFSLSFVDAEGYTEVRHFQTEILNTDDEPFVSTDVIAVQREDHYAYGSVYALDFDGLSENPFEEATHVISIEQMMEDQSQDSTGTVQSPQIEGAVWTSRGTLNHITNFAEDEDPGGERGFFYTEGMTLWAPLDGQLTDTLTNTNLATQPANASDWTSNRFGQADKALRTEDAPGILLLPAEQLSSPDEPRPLAISLWFTLEESLNNDSILLSNVSENISPESQLEISCQGEMLTVNAAGVEHSIKANGHSWNHLVLTFDNLDSNLTGYINGLLAFNELGTEPLQLPHHPVALAGRPDGSGQWLGAIDDIAIWNRTLTYGEATSLHKQEGARFQHEPELDQDNRTTVNLIIENSTAFVRGRYDQEMAKRDGSYIVINHMPVIDYGCADETALNFDTRALRDSTDNANFDVMNARFCEYPDLSKLSWTPNDALSRSAETLSIPGDSDNDGVIDTEEISGCNDPAACNYNPEATDSYANYSFLDYLHVGATDSTQFYISREPVTWDQAIIDAEAAGGHIGTIHTREEALLLASRTQFSDEIALAPADTLYLTGHKFSLLGEAAGSRYYISETDSLSMYEWMHSPNVNWAHLKENLLMVDDAAENAALTSLLVAAEVPYAWLPLTDDDFVGIGEGNWTNLRDSSNLGYSNWGYPPVDNDRNFVNSRHINDFDYDYAQIWANGTISGLGSFGTQTSGQNHEIQPGEWALIQEDAVQQYYNTSGEVEVAARPPSSYSNCKEGGAPPPSISQLQTQTGTTWPPTHAPIETFRVSRCWKFPATQQRIAASQKKSVNTA